MTAVYVIIGALATLTAVLLTCEHFGATNRRINALARLDAEHPRPHLRIVRGDGAAS